MTTPVWYGTVGIPPAPDRHRGNGLIGRVRHRLRWLVRPFTQALAGRPGARPNVPAESDAPATRADRPPRLAEHDGATAG